MDLPMFYDEAEEWGNALLLYDAALKEINTKLEILNNEFKMAHQYNPIEHITSRIKSPQSIAKKLRHNQKELTVENIVKYVNDVGGYTNYLFFYLGYISYCGSDGKTKRYQGA